MTVERYKIGKDAINQGKIDDDAVGAAELKDLKAGSVSIDIPVISATDVGTASVAVASVEVTDKILVMMQEDAPKTAIPIAAYCSEAGVLTVQFANISAATATAAAKEILWQRNVL